VNALQAAHHSSKIKVGKFCDMRYLHSAFSDTSAEQNDHVDYEESFFLFLEAETVIYASLIDFGEEQGKLTWNHVSNVFGRHSFGYVESRMMEVGSQEEGGFYMTTPARCPGKHVVYLPSFGDTLQLLVPGL